MKTKRRHLPGAQKPQSRLAGSTNKLNQGSRFVHCPLCGDHLAWHAINLHLDTVHALFDGAPPRQASAQARDCADRPSGPSLSPHLADAARGVDHVAGLLSCKEPVATVAEPTADSVASQPWWQAAVPGTHLLASAKFISNTRQAVSLTDEKLSSLTPCELVRDALPLKLANRLLRLLLSDGATWTRGIWYMGGKKHIAPRTSSYYSLQDAQGATVVPGSNETALDVSSSVDTQMASPELQEAASLVSDHVNRLAGRLHSNLASSDRDGWQCSYALCNMYQDGEERVGSHADRLTMLGPRPIIASLSLGATRTFRIRSMAPEADCTAQPDSCSSGQQLEPAPLVPECQSAAICASPQGPSEGAMESCEGQGSDQGLLETGQRSQQQRQPGEQHNADRAELPQLNNMPSKLLLRQQQGSLDNSMGAAAQPTQQSCSVGGRQSVCSADVQLPHNTLVIMWPPMQEAWKHEVPKCKSVESHSIAGKSRINLTFRRLKPEWAEQAPCCRCGQQAVLKASLPSSAASQQRYYYTCDNTKGPGCGFFSWAQVAV